MTVMLVLAAGGDKIIDLLVPVQQPYRASLTRLPRSFTRRAATAATRRSRCIRVMSSKHSTAPFAVLVFIGLCGGRRFIAGEDEARQGAHSVWNGLRVTKDQVIRLGGWVARDRV